MISARFSSAPCPRKAGWAAKSDRKAPNVEAGRTGTAGAQAEDRATQTIVLERFKEARLRTAGSGLCGSAAHPAFRGPSTCAGRLRPAPQGPGSCDAVDLLMYRSGLIVGAGPAGANPMRARCVRQGSKPKAETGKRARFTRARPASAACGRRPLRKQILDTAANGLITQRHGPFEQGLPDRRCEDAVVGETSEHKGPIGIMPSD